MPLTSRNTSLNALHRSIRRCRKCRSCETRRHAVPGEAWLDEQIALVDPVLLVLTGKVALRQVLGYRGSMQDVHGRIRRHQGRRVLPTHHPAAGMRFPEIADRMRKDFRKIRQAAQM